MKYFLKYLFFLSLILSFTITSCSYEEDHDLSGIKLATARSSGESDGRGLACNYGKIIKEDIQEADFDEVKDIYEKEGGEDFDKEKFDEILEELFGFFTEKTMYVIVAGENLDFESKEDVGVSGETFSLTWYSETEEPIVGTYEATAVKINIETPNDLENGAEVSYGKIKVVLTDLTDKIMIGTFNGTVTNNESVEESINGTFNVERVSCDK